MNDQRHEERIAAGARIDPATAEVWFKYAYLGDPYDELGPDPGGTTSGVCGSPPTPSSR